MESARGEWGREYRGANPERWSQGCCYLALLCCKTVLLKYSVILLGLSQPFLFLRREESIDNLFNILFLAYNIS